MVQSGNDDRTLRWRSRDAAIYPWLRVPSGGCMSDRYKPGELAACGLSLAVHIHLSRFAAAVGRVFKIPSFPSAQSPVVSALSLTRFHAALWDRLISVRHSTSVSSVKSSLKLGPTLFLSAILPPSVL